MKISMINGSPKVNTSCSGLLLEQARKDIMEQRKDLFSAEDFNIYRININPLSDTDIAEIVKSDIIVVAFPLYVDGIPSHMLSALYQLEEAFVTMPDAPKPTFYGIVNNGFSESFQNQHAASMLKLFCERAGITFGQVFALGAGEMTRSMIESNIPVGQGPLSHMKDDWAEFIIHITNLESASPIFCSPKFPDWVFNIIGNHTFWTPAAKANGISKKDMNRKKVYSPN